MTKNKKSRQLWAGDEPAIAECRLRNHYLTKSERDDIPRVRVVAFENVAAMHDRKFLELYRCNRFERMAALASQHGPF